MIVARETAEASTPARISAGFPFRIDVGPQIAAVEPKVLPELHEWDASEVKPFDPFPYILLNLVLACLTVLQAPLIMMSQNRQAAPDRLDAQHDYEVNTKAEMEVAGLHAKLDEIRDVQWLELIKIQQQQLALLTELAASRARTADS